jgi:hypothetical protein
MFPSLLEHRRGISFKPPKFSVLRAAPYPLTLI